MPNVVEEIPAHLAPAARAALDWINRERDAQFKLTGLVDPPETVGVEPAELGLVLCQDDVCLREQVRIRADGSGFHVSAAGADDAVIPPHLDPPAGVRKSWLDQQLGSHAFVVLVFYRGFW